MTVKKVDWDNRDRMSKLASVMYPNLSDPETQREMLSLAQAEGKQAALVKRMKADIGAEMRNSRAKRS